MQQELYKEQKVTPLMMEYLYEMSNEDLYDEHFDECLFSIKIDLLN